LRFYARLLGLVAALPILLAGSVPWNPEPWLRDLAQIQTAIDTDYPNRDWLTNEREVTLEKWFDRAADTIRNSDNDVEARRALEALIKRFNDGHLRLDWPAERADAPNANPTLTPPTTVSDFCVARGFDAEQVSAGLSSNLPGYMVLPNNVFEIGTIKVRSRQVGILRIGVFSPFGYPNLCAQAVATAKLTIDQPCDDTCHDRLITETHDLMTRALIDSIERLKRAGAKTLLIDISQNGGGTDWTEAAARIVSPVPIQSAPVHVIRNQVWVERWRSLASKLRKDAAVDLANKADALATGLEPCSQAACTRLAPVGFSSGLVAQASPRDFESKPWGAEVFTPSQFPYRESVWQGPLVILVDGDTWSAAEQFAALIRDNDAGVVIGERTGGAGCGYMYDSQPIVLKHSKAELTMPNCARLRRDGSNEVGGIVPDILTGVRLNDGPGFAARMTFEKLPDAVAEAQRLRR
jgi:Peptidase family S41